MNKKFIMGKWLSFRPWKLLALFFASYLSVLMIGGWTLPAFSQNAPAEIRGVWLTTSDTDTIFDRPKMKEAIANLSSMNFNTIYPVVWNSGYALYPSPVAQRAGIQPFIHRGFQGQEPLAELIDEAHRQQLLVLPWFEFGFMAPPTSELALNHPNWLTQAQNGSQTTSSAAGEVVWLNPFHPEVQQFISSLVMEVVNRYDIDGIQFDDHLALPVSLGYDSYTRNLYHQETNQNPPTNYRDAAWVRWRADKITQFVARLNQQIKARKPNAIFSISPNPYSTAYNSFLQDWLDWVRKDLINELIVQVYRADLSAFVREISSPEIREAREKIPVGIGILTGLGNRIKSIDFIRDKTLAVRRERLGVSFFFYGSMWNRTPESKAERKSNFRALFPRQSHRSATILNPVPRYGI